MAPRDKSSIEIQGFSKFVAVKDLYVSGALCCSGTVKVKDSVICDKGDLILSSSSSKIMISGNIEVHGDIFTTGRVYDEDSNLILSSAIGSVIAASGSLDFPNTDKTYHIRAVNSDLILSSTFKDVAFSSSLNIVNANNKNYSIKASDGDLILSSSKNSKVIISGTLNIDDISGTVSFVRDAFNQGSHVVARNSDLILSSSLNSKVILSGGCLQILSGVNPVGSFYNNGIVFGPQTSAGAAISTKGTTFYFNAADGSAKSTAYFGTLYSDGGIYNATVSQVFAWSTRTKLLSPADGALKITNNAGNKVCFQFAEQSSGSITCPTGSLILSSSDTSIVTISGNLRTNGFRIGYRSLTSQTTLIMDDNFIEADATAGSFGVVLPTAIGNPGKTYHVKKTDVSANAVVVSGSGAELVDGVAIKVVPAQYSSVSVISNGIGWLIF
jgi:hypothetical protein